MAKITQLPEQSIIDSLRGVLDFSVWCNLIIVRKWPRHTAGPRSQPVQRTSNQFIVLNSQLKVLDPGQIAAFTAMASGTSFTWKDMATRFYLNAEVDLHEYQQ